MRIWATVTIFAQSNLNKLAQEVFEKIGVAAWKLHESESDRYSFGKRYEGTVMGARVTLEFEDDSVSEAEQEARIARFNLALNAPPIDVPSRPQIPSDSLDFSMHLSVRVAYLTGHPTLAFDSINNQSYIISNENGRIRTQVATPDAISRLLKSA